MATIGTFTASDNGFIGSIKTLTLNIKARFAATEKDNDKAPDYRIFAGATEFGAAWKKTARDSDREYLSVKLDDPSFPAPIYASLVKSRGRRGFTPDLVPPQRRLIQLRDRLAPPLRRRGFSASLVRFAQEAEKSISCLKDAKGSALARARVKPPMPVPAGRVSPVFRAVAEFS